MIYISIREDFEQFLKGNNNISNIYNKRKSKNMNDISSFLANDIPSKLYRYRTYNKNNLNSLINDEVWGVHSSRFNDLFDCVPCIDFNSITKFIDYIVDYDSIHKSLENIKKHDTSDYFINKLDKTIVDEIKKQILHLKIIN